MCPGAKGPGSIMEKDGFNFMNFWDAHWFLQLESDRLEECIRYCRDHGIKWLHVSPFHGYLLRDLDCFKDLRDVEAVHLQNSRNGEIADFDGLYQAEKLKYISADFHNPLHFSRFPALTHLVTHYTPDTAPSLFDSLNLRFLALTGYRTKHRSLLEVGALKELQLLSVFNSPIESTEGAGVLEELTHLVLGYCTGLRDIKPLASVAGNLESVEIHCCKRLEGLYEFLQTLASAKRLVISNCGSLPSLDFVRGLPKLEELFFPDTDILDGDLSPCLRLKLVGFLNKRHYSHSVDEIRALVGMPPVRV